MKGYIIPILILISFKGFSQQDEINQLESQKEKLTMQVQVLNDSIKKLDIKIIALKSKKIIKTVNDSTLKGIVRSGAKLKKTAHPLGELITTLTADEEVLILDYKAGYFGVCIDSICGYMNELWIVKDQLIIDFKKFKEAEEQELKKLERQQKLKTKKAEYAELEKGYIKKYGERIYNKLKQGHYWIGMNREMATISLGRPNDINRSVGPWGVHEQWVYDSLYLYFENGKLTSFQE